MITALARMAANLAELVLPRTCLGCDADRVPWCLGCFRAEFAPGPHRPEPAPADLPMLAAAAPYAGSVRSAVLAAKERDRRDLDRALGAALAAAVGAAVSASWPKGGRPGRLWLVPVPASPAAARARGRDHVRDWAEQAARCLQAADIAACWAPALRRGSGGRDSVGLDASERASNLRGAFTVGPGFGPPPSGTSVVIVDDIVTTGATLAVAHACLSAAFGQAGKPIRAAVVAATQRHQRWTTEDTSRPLAEPAKSY